MTGILSPLISGLALVWAIYQFVIKSRDERNEEKVRFIGNAIEMQKAYLEKELYDLKIKIGKQEEEMARLKISVISLISESKNSSVSFKETVQRWEKTLDRHEEKLDTFGKVIVKDR